MGKLNKYKKKSFFTDNTDLSDDHIDELIDKSLLIKILQKNLAKAKIKLENDKIIFQNIKKDRKKSCEKRQDLDNNFKRSQKKLISQGKVTDDQKMLCDTIKDSAYNYWELESYQLETHTLYTELIQIEQDKIIILEKTIRELDRNRYNVIKNNPLLKKLHKL